MVISPVVDAAMLDQRVGRDRGAVAEIDDAPPVAGRRPGQPFVDAAAMAREGSSGVLGTFQTRMAPLASSTRQISVNVPPESTPTRHIPR